MLLRIVKSTLFAAFTSISLIILAVVIKSVSAYLEVRRLTHGKGIGAVASGVGLNQQLTLLAIFFLLIFTSAFLFSWKRS